MVTRMQVTLEEPEHRKAKQKAAALGVSLAEYIRRLVAADVEDAQPPVDVSIVFNLGKSDGSEVARHKDAYLAAAVDALHPQRGRQSG